MTLLENIYLQKDVKWCAWLTAFKSDLFLSSLLRDSARSKSLSQKPQEMGVGRTAKILTALARLPETRTRSPPNRRAVWWCTCKRHSLHLYYRTWAWRCRWIMCSDAGHTRLRDTKRQNIHIKCKASERLNGRWSLPPPILLLLGVVLYRVRRSRSPRAARSRNGGVEPAHVQKINPIRVNYKLSTGNADEGLEFRSPQWRPVSPKRLLIQLKLQQSVPKFTPVRPRIEQPNPHSLFSAWQMYENFARTALFPILPVAPVSLSLLTIIYTQIFTTV
jgi:hypothetical protein